MKEGSEFAGRVALVTGAGRGIGEGIARYLAARGATVVIADVDIDTAEQAATAIRSEGGEAVAFNVDVTSESSVVELVDRTRDLKGRLDIAVNNAGVLGVAPIADITADDWDRVLDVNAKGVFLCSKHEVIAMRELATGEGRIINIASLAGKVGLPLQTHYSASKFAVVGFTNALAKELASEGITVNSICPGIVGTRMWLGDEGTAKAKSLPGETEEQSWVRHQKTMLPQGIAQTVDDIGRAVAFLADSPHITGQALSVDGGAGNG